MEGFQRQYDKEYMKMAMLKHEETFRKQVGELHRLYRIQKMLMRDMKMNSLRRQQMLEDHQSGVLEGSHAESKRIPRQAGHGYELQATPGRELDLELPAEDDGGVEEESEIELTLATGGGRGRKEAAASFTSDSATSFSSSSTESGGENSRFQGWGLLLRTRDGNRGGFPADGKSEFDVDGAGREDRVEQPPWLFQCLSLNMT